jgi:hypothetical protein
MGLIMSSEIGYYLDETGLARLTEQVTAALSRGGDALLTHWRADIDDHLRAGDAVHEIFRRPSSLHTVSRLEGPDVLAELFRHEPRSLTQRAGLRP